MNINAQVTNLNKSIVCNESDSGHDAGACRHDDERRGRYSHNGSDGEMQVYSRASWHIATAMPPRIQWQQQHVRNLRLVGDFMKLIKPVFWSDAVRITATIALLSLSWIVLSGCHAPSEQEIQEDKEFFPRRSRVMSADDKWCVRQARLRIAALDKKPWGTPLSWDWSFENLRNIDPKSGEERSDVWVGPHLFSFPFRGGIGFGLWHKQLPGAGAYLNVQIPVMQPMEPVEAKANRFRINDFPTLADIHIDCRPALTLAKNLEHTNDRTKLLRRTEYTTRNSYPELGLEAEETAYQADYVPFDGLPKKPSGGYLFFQCEKIQNLRPDLALCRTSFLYRDGVLVHLKFHSAYLPHWQLLYANTLSVLDEAYRGNQ